MHGKDGRVYARNKKGHVGTGLNDLIWGAYNTPSDSSYFEVEIDTVDTPDTFRWRENGGAWTEDVAITGAAQNLVGANGTQVITFAATTGHTLSDKWTIGNLYAEPCTESGATAQITDAAMRLLNPNAAVVFTDSGGANCIHIDYVRGKATFDANVATVTVAAVNGFVPAAALFAAGYLYEWTMDVAFDVDEIPAFGDDWKTALVGLAEAKGSAAGYLMGKQWFDRMFTSPESYFLAKFFTYDPDADMTGDHFTGWVRFSGYGATAPINKVVNAKINFMFAGSPAFTANT